MIKEKTTCTFLADQESLINFLYETKKYTYDIEKVSFKIRGIFVIVFAAKEIIKLFFLFSFFDSVLGFVFYVFQKI